MTTIPDYKNSAQTEDRRVADLLARMTLSEKIDQLHQCAVGDANPNNIQERPDQFRATYGSYILNGAEDRPLRDELQRRCLEESRLGIPAIFGADVIHGYRTIFPIPLAQACGWNPELVRTVARAAAVEARAAGVDWTFAPMLDQCVDPRWGRIAETFGEAPHAACVFGAAAVEGYQGQCLDAEDSVAACLKHFVGYGASEGGRDYSATDISPQRLWELHLPPFAAGVRAGALTVMSAFNDLNGIPATANASILTRILRERWGFSGLVVSDWNAVLQLCGQGFAADEAEAAGKALLAGVDLDMADGLYRRHLTGAIADGRVPREALDLAVSRVLRVKFRLGLFERPFAGRGRSVTAFLPEHRARSLESAAETAVLLNNREGILPIAPSVRRIAVVGPLADGRAELLGSWAAQGRAEDVTTILEGIRSVAPNGTEIKFARGCSLGGSDDDGSVGEAVALARTSDLMVLCLGEAATMSGENASRALLRLPGAQMGLATKVASAGKPVVVLLVSGRPVDLEGIEERAVAVLALWQPGTAGGLAAAELLFGKRNPSGRLAVTWPRSPAQIPTYHHMRPRARGLGEGRYQDLDTAPLFPFGHGLSYTEFEYGPIELDRAEVGADEILSASVTVTNRGRRAGAEAVLWFIHDPAASITRPLCELKHFEKVRLGPGETSRVQFAIEPRRDLSFPDANGNPVLEAGDILLSAGPRQARFRVRLRSSAAPDVRGAAPGSGRADFIPL
ncbi:beta-glucosidase [Opitutaceae bacterium EW11]|nr:beta-glucosidase [Opitutaceae bacterium EW11]